MHTNSLSGDPNQGIDLKIVMNRRIINELLTTYLPTVFIICIVYATNFFKSFFFEAQVTVNLTSLLVLTTLFISVSKSPHRLCQDDRHLAHIRSTDSIC